LDWDQWCSNVTYLLDSGKLRSLHVMCTINALCLLSLDEFLWQIIKLKQKYGKDSINFSLNILRFPSFQSPLILPLEIRQAACEQLAKIGYTYIDSTSGMLHEYEYNQLARLISYLQEVDTPHNNAVSKDILCRDFKNFYLQYDQRRSKNFAETFSELQEWYSTL